jgi:hypothetical protein
LLVDLTNGCHEEPAERPERLSAERRGWLLIEQDDAPSSIGQLGRGDKAGEARTHDDDVRAMALIDRRGRDYAPRIRACR